MAQIASLIKRVVLDREDPASVREDVKKMMSSFKTVKFSFESGDEAYRFIGL
jgi:glycine/serine hydroxymethyltransferase